MERTYVVTGAASGIGAATARLLAGRGARVITSDLHDADVIADLATAEGRGALVEGVRDRSDGRVDGVVANAGGGPEATMLALNFFGAVATLEGLRPFLAFSAAPRAVAVSSIASLRLPPAGLVEACLALDEGAAIAAAPPMRDVQTGLDLYGAAKRALQLWCRREATGPDWAAAGIPLNVVALGFYDTPAAAYVLSDPTSRATMAELAPLRGAFPGRPEEAAALLAWCVSAENSQMTGQILYADAGIECRGRPERAA